MRVVHTRRQSIAVTLQNFRRAAKDFNEKSTVKCLCDNNAQHTVRLPEDFTGITGQVLQQNSKNIPFPSEINSEQELFDAFQSMLSQAEKLLNQSQENQRNFAAHGSYMPNSCELANL